MVNSNVVSSSSRIFEYLKTLSQDAAFTSMMLVEELKVTSGAVSGFLSKLNKAGAVKVVGRSDGNLVYVTVPDNFVKVRIRTSTTQGSKKGHVHSGTPQVKRVSELLHQIADQVGAMKVGLDAFSTEELLKEVMRRQREEKS